MLKKFLSATLTVSSLFLFSTVEAKAGQLVEPKTFYPSYCRIVVDDTTATCTSVTIGATSNYSSVNVKLCDSTFYYCLILVADISELHKFPNDLMRIKMVGWESGGKIQKWKSTMFFGPFQDGIGIAGVLDNGVALAAYFE